MTMTQNGNGGIQMGGRKVRVGMWLMLIGTVSHFAKLVGVEAGATFGEWSQFATWLFGALFVALTAEHFAKRNGGSGAQP